MLKTTFWLNLSFFVCAFAFLNPTSAHAAPPDPLSAVCAPTLQLQHSGACPALGPIRYAHTLEKAGLPYPLPPVAITLSAPYLGLTPDAYMRVVSDTAPVYRHPLEAEAGLPPIRYFEKGYVFVSLKGRAMFNNHLYYQINTGEYLPAEILADARPSTFAGMHFATPPGGLFGWVSVDARPSPAPGAPPLPETRYIGQYHPFTVQAVQHVGDWDWYQIAPDQWVEQRHTAIVNPAPPPGAESGTVIAVNTYEQTLAVYQNGALTFATLVSSGSRYFPTRPGTFKVWAKIYRGEMSGAYLDDRSDYYFIEDVPWILYYDGDRALHGAFWHNNFGQQHSHGCINLAPKDARWLYDHFGVGATVIIYSSAP